MVKSTRDLNDWVVRGMPEQLIYRLRANPPAAIKQGNKYYCNIHCPICYPHQNALITDPKKLWALGMRHKNHVELDAQGLCSTCLYYEGQIEFDRREAELERAIEEYYEEKDGDDSANAGEGIWKAFSNYGSYRSPEEKKRLR